jgi:hypothetical protein
MRIDKRARIDLPELRAPQCVQEKTMQEFAMFLGLVLLWSIARSLRRIVRLIETAKLTIDIPFGGPGGDPGERKPEGNVVALGKRKAA